MTTSGIIPAPRERARRRGLAGTCGAPYDLADPDGLYCELPEGHPGLHEATVVIDWDDTVPP